MATILEKLEEWVDNFYIIKGRYPSIGEVTDKIKELEQPKQKSDG